MGSKHDIADVLVIGAGASGGAFTWSLTQAGVKVVCLEQGGWVPLNAFPVNEPQAQLHWQTDFHPNPNFRGLAEDYPVNEDDTPIAPYMYNAVGGSTIHWGSHFPRFHPSDFRLKSLDGVADDWPMDYFELEPYYDQNDRAHGVSGLQGDPAYPPKPARPTPPLPIGPGGEKLARAFNQLGWHWWSSDNAIASATYDGRPADVGEHLRSPSSSDIIFWPSALKQGARLITHARVREILVDAGGRATGAAYYDRNGDLQAQYAKVVVLAGNGIGTSRLLLNSKSCAVPRRTGQQQRAGGTQPDAPSLRLRAGPVRRGHGAGRRAARLFHAEPGVLRDRRAPGVRARLRHADIQRRRRAACRSPWAVWWASRWNGARDTTGTSPSGSGIRWA